MLLVSALLGSRVSIRKDNPSKNRPNLATLSLLQADNVRTAVKDIMTGYVLITLAVCIQAKGTDYATITLNFMYQEP